MNSLRVQTFTPPNINIGPFSKQTRDKHSCLISAVFKIYTYANVSNVVICPLRLVTAGVWPSNGVCFVNKYMYPVFDGSPVATILIRFFSFDSSLGRRTINKQPLWCLYFYVV